MKIETSLARVLAELDRAEKLHPVWPNNHVYQAAIVGEEAGELLQASLNFDEKKGTRRAMISEAVHTAAVALRFLKNIVETDDGE